MSTTSTITSLPLASGIDGAADWFAIDRTSLGVTQRISRNTMLGITGAPVGTTDSQTLTNKNLSYPTLTIKDNALIVQDDGDTTKQLQFQLSGISTGTTRTLTVPNANTTIVGTDATQTLTNKTLTAPVINNGSITGTTITTDSIVGQSASTSGTVYGLSVASSKISGTSITNATITGTQLATGAVLGANVATSAIKLGYAEITSNFTTTTTSAYVDVTSLTVTVTVPAGGRDLEITAFAGGFKTSAVAGTAITFAITEGSTVLGSTTINEPVSAYNCTAICIARVSAPSPGSHTYKVQCVQSAAGTLTIAAGAANPAAGAYGPAFILVKAI